MSGRVLGALVALLIAGAGTAVAVAPLEPARTSFRALDLPEPVQKPGLERRWWGFEVRTTGDDVPFPEREPAVFVAARDVDPATQLVKSVAIVVRNAKASGWLGGPGATAKVEVLQTNALQGAVALLDDPQAKVVGEGETGFAGALAEAAPATTAEGKRRVVAVLPLASDWPALDRALAFALTESLVKQKAADVVDVDSAERFLGDLGIEPRTVRAADPPLAIWAQALGVDAVAAVRATSVRAVNSADEGPDFLSAEVLWSRADGTIDRNVTTLRVPHRTYPARGKLKVVLAHADDLTEEMIPKLPAAGTGGTLFASRDVNAPGAGTTTAREGSEDPATGIREVAAADRALTGANGGTATPTGEDPSMVDPGFRSGSGDAREVPFADAFGRGTAEDAANPTVAGERGTGGSRNVGSATTASGATMESLSIGVGPDGSVGGNRSVDGANGGRGGSMEDLSLGSASGERGTSGRGVDGASGRSGSGMEDPSLAGANGERGTQGRGVDGANGRTGSGLEDPSLAGPGTRGGTDSRNGSGVDAAGRGSSEELALLTPGRRVNDPEPDASLDYCALKPKARKTGAASWSVHHPLNQKQIIPDGHPMLEAIARELAADRGARVRVTGHTCNVGETPYNFTLGSGRADTARDRLIELGVPASRIDSTSQGEENPVCTNETRVGRMNNRRTEIRIEAGSDRTEDR